MLETVLIERKFDVDDVMNYESEIMIESIELVALIVSPLTALA